MNEWKQPHRFTSYERDGLGADDAMARRYNRWWGAFDQADPFDGSYSLTDPQSFNRYSYVENDPVNFVDPSGLLPMCGLFSFDDGRYGFVCFGINDPWGGYFPPDKPGGGGDGGTDGPAAPQQQNNGKSDCANFVDFLVAAIASVPTSLSKLDIGRLLGADVTLGNNKGRFNNNRVSGFKEMYVRDQGAYAYAHIQGIAGAFLIGNNPIVPGRSETGNQRIGAQYAQDFAQLAEAFQNNDQRSINERTSEINDDNAGMMVGGILSATYDGEKSFKEARDEIFNLLCDN